MVKYNLPLFYLWQGVNFLVDCLTMIFVSLIISRLLNYDLHSFCIFDGYVCIWNQNTTK